MAFLKSLQTDAEREEAWRAMERAVDNAMCVGCGGSLPCCCRNDD